MFVNLTQHVITLLQGENDTIWGRIPTSGTVARVPTTSEPMDPVQGISCTRTRFGAVEGVPPREEGTVYIVSRLVLEAAKDFRDDVYAPGELVRDPAGQVIGCRGLSR